MKIKSKKRIIIPIVMMIVATVTVILYTQRYNIVLKMVNSHVFPQFPSEPIGCFGSKKQVFVYGKGYLRIGNFERERKTYASHSINVSKKGAKLKVFKATFEEIFQYGEYEEIPKSVIRVAKKYIKQNGYDKKDIAFVFLNYLPPYYVEEFYKDVSVNRCFVIDENNVILSGEGLKKPEELSGVQIEKPVISIDKVYGLAHGYEKEYAEKINTLLWLADVKWCFFQNPEDEEAEIQLAYQVATDFNVMYIDGTTGELLYLKQYREPDK